MEQNFDFTNLPMFRNMSEQERKDMLKYEEERESFKNIVWANLGYGTRLLVFCLAHNLEIPESMLKKIPNKEKMKKLSSGNLSDKQIAEILSMPVEKIVKLKKDAYDKLKNFREINKFINLE